MNKHILGIGLFWTAALTAAGASAQTSSTTSTPVQPPATKPYSGKLEEIVVTASRRSENLQKAPVAVIALSGAKLESQGIKSSLDLQQATPGLTYSDNANFSEPYIRGVGTDITTPGAESSVATYIDGVYQASPYFGVQDLIEVNRVEVLEGPQGTLYGRNATGGVINILTKDPPNTFQANVSGTVGTYYEGDGTAYIGGPLTEGLTGDLAVAESRHGGYGEALNTGRDTDFLDRQYLRAKLLYQPNDNFSIKGSLQLLNSYDTAGGYTYLTKYGASPLAPVLGGKVTYDSYDIYSAYPFKNDTQGEQANIKTVYDLNGITFTALSAYTNLRARIFPDFISSNIPIFDFDADTDRDRTFQQDLFVSGNNYGLGWTAGFSYLNDQASFSPIYTYSGPTRNASIFATVDTVSYAGFVDLNYKINSLFTIGGGIRYDTDTKEQAQLDFGNGEGVIEASTPSSQRTYDNATYRAVLQYTPDWGMIYAKFETGFKSGSVNAEAPEQYVPPEKIKSYALGLKSEAFDRRVRFNAEAFYYDYSDLQSQYTDVATGGSYFETAKAATVYGAEFNMDVAATDQLTLTSGVSLLHTRFNNFISNGSYVVVDGFDVAQAGLDLAGKQLTHSPPVTANLGVNYEVPLHDDSNLVFTADAFYTDKYYFDVTNRIYQGAYATLNSQVRWNLPDGHTSITAWGRNLSDAKYLSVAVDTAFGDDGQLAPPRTYGVTFRYRY